MGIDGGGLLISPDGVTPTPPGLSVCLPLVILPGTIKFRRSFLLAQYKGREMVVVVLIQYFLLWLQSFKLFSVG